MTAIAALTTTHKTPDDAVPSISTVKFTSAGDPESAILVTPRIAESIYNSETISFADVTESSDVASWLIQTDDYLTANYSPIPLPPGTLLLLTGLAGLGLAGWCRRKAA